MTGGTRWNMCPTFARIARCLSKNGVCMQNTHIERNGQAHVPTCATTPTAWPPPWVDGATEPPPTPTPKVEPAPQIVALPPESDTLSAYSEHCWEGISSEARDHLLGPRERPAPCPWCGGRTRHGALCVELRASWEPTLPFGKHRGKRLSDVPTDYLRWLLRNSHSLDSELRTAITERIRQ